MEPVFIKTNHKYIALVDNLISDEMCDKLVQLAEDEGIEDNPGKVIMGKEIDDQIYDKDARSCFELYLHEKTGLQHVGDYVLSVMKNAMLVYRQNVMHIPGDFEFEDPRVVKYPPGGYFKPHVDSRSPRDWFDRGYRLYRSFTCILYLNDCKTGDTAFFQQNMGVKPKKGAVLVFPSYKDFVHASMPTEEETKYAAISWLGSTRNHMFTKVGEDEYEFKESPIE